MALPVLRTLKALGIAKSQTLQIPHNMRRGTKKSNSNIAKNIQTIMATLLRIKAPKNKMPEWNKPNIPIVRENRDNISITLILFWGSNNGLRYS